MFLLLYESLCCTTKKNESKKKLVHVTDSGTVLFIHIPTFHTSNLPFYCHQTPKTLHSSKVSFEQAPEIILTFTCNRTWFMAHCSCRQWYTYDVHGIQTKQTRGLPVSDNPQVDSTKPSLTYIKF